MFNIRLLDTANFDGIAHKKGVKQPCPKDMKS